MAEFVASVTLSIVDGLNILCSRSADDPLNDLASDLGSTELLSPEEAAAKMHTQNQALLTRLRSLTHVQAENARLKARIVELKKQSVSVRAILFPDVLVQGDVKCFMRQKPQWQHPPFSRFDR